MPSTDATAAARPLPLPAGDVTFVFTDVVGSTRLFAALGDRFVGILEDHNTLVCTAMERYDGALVRNEGDGLFYAFHDAGDAVRGCLAAQRALVSHDWPADCPLEVRMGAHRGTAWPTGGDYIALPVHVAARVVDTAHGGQIVVSAAVADAASAAGLGDDARLSDLGLFQLRDVGDPVRLVQVDDRQRRTFPPPRATPVAGHNIPIARTSLVGRTADGAKLAALVGASNRLVTVVGPGGVGKTRLAGEVAGDQVARFGGGVWQIPLATVSDPQLVASATAAILGVRQDAGAGVTGALIEALRARARTLLLFDGCEHLLDAAADIIDALLAATDVYVLATSREPLQVAGEHVFRLGPLAVDPTAAAPPAAAELFLARARSTGSNVVWDTTTAPLLVDICRRLDGLPLAIELVAARVGPLPLSDIATGLDDRFALARRTRSRGGEARQQTLEASVAWSYERLHDDERGVLDAVSIFAATFTVAAAARVASDANASVTADTLGRLVIKSLVERVDDGFRLLESIRDYARRQLQQHSAHDDVRQRFADHYVDWSRARSSRDDETFEQVRRELPNLRDALRVTTLLGDWAGAAEMLHALNLYWARAGYAPDTQELVQQLYAHRAELTPRALAIVLCVGAAFGLGVAVNPGSRAPDAVDSTLRAVTAADAAQEPWLQVLARSVVAMQLLVSDAAAARRHLDDAHAIALRANLDTGVAAAMTNLGVLAHALGAHADARANYLAAIDAADRSGMSFSKAITLANLGELEIDDGQPAAALPYLREALIVAEAHGFVFVAALATGLIGEAQVALGDPFAGKLLDDAVARLDRLVEGDPSLQGYLRRFADAARRAAT